MITNFSPDEIKRLEKQFGVIPDYFSPAYFEGRLDAIAKIKKPVGRVLKHGKGKCPTGKGWVQPKGRKGFCRTLPEVSTLQNPVNKWGKELPQEPQKSQFPFGLIVGGIGGAAIGGAIALTMSGQQSRDDVSRKAYEGLQQELDKETIKAREAQVKYKEANEKAARNEAEKIEIEIAKAKSDGAVIGLKKQLEDLKNKAPKTPPTPATNANKKDIEELKKKHEKELAEHIREQTAAENSLTQQQRISSDLEQKLAVKVKDEKELLKIKAQWAEYLLYKDPEGIYPAHVVKKGENHLAELKKAKEKTNEAIAEKKKIEKELLDLIEEQTKTKLEKESNEKEIEKGEQEVIEKQAEVGKTSEEIEQLTKAKESSEQTLKQIKETLEKAGVSKEALASTKPEELLTAIEGLKASAVAGGDAIREGIDKQEYDKVLNQLTEFKNNQLSIAKKLFGIKETVVDEEEIRKIIAKEIEVNPDEVDFFDDLLTRSKDLNTQEKEYELLTRDVTDLALEVLGKEANLSSPKEIKKTLEKIKVKAISEGGVDTTRLSQIESKYNQLDNALIQHANDFLAKGNDANSRLGAIAELAKKSQDLEGQVKTIQGQLTAKQTEYDKQAEALNTSQQSNNNLLRQNNEFVFTTAEQQRRIDQLTSDLKTSQELVDGLQNSTASADEIASLNEKHAQAISEAKDKYDQDLATALEKQRLDMAEREAQLLVNFDRKTLKESPEQQDIKKLNGFLLNNPDDGISLEASMGWKSTFFNKRVADRNDIVTKTCSDISAQMYASAQSDLLKRAIVDLEGKTESDPSGYSLKTFTPLTEKIKNFGTTTDLGELHQLYQEIKGGINSNVEGATKEAYENIRSTKPVRQEIGKEQVNKAYEQLSQIEYTHQVLKLREQALSKVSASLNKAYTDAHLNLIKNVDPNDDASLRAFDEQSLQMTRDLAKEMTTITQNLLDKNRFEKELEKTKGFIADPPAEFIAKSRKYEFDKGASNEEKQEYLGYDFLNALTGVDRERIKEIFPSAFSSEQTKKQ